MYQHRFSSTAKGKQLGSWEDFGPCEGIGENNSCGKGKQKRRRKCIDGDIDKCSAADTEMTVSCNLPDCAKQLGNWENIGACMTDGEQKTCGSGNQQQARSCVDGTVDKCIISDKERIIPCHMKNCEKRVGSWKNDGSCKATGKNKNCGPGNQIQTRQCTDGTVAKCAEEDRKRSVPCSLPNCKKHLSKWENDGECKAVEKDKNCGPGFQQQTRICKDGTGDKCTTHDTEREIPCDLPKCPSIYIYINK